MGTNRIEGRKNTEEKKTEGKE